MEIDPYQSFDVFHAVRFYAGMFFYRRANWQTFTRPFAETCLVVTNERGGQRPSRARSILLEIFRDHSSFHHFKFALLQCYVLLGSCVNF